MINSALIIMNFVFDDLAAELRTTKSELKSIQNAKAQHEKNNEKLKDDLASALNRSKADTSKLDTDCSTKE